MTRDGRVEPVLQDKKNLGSGRGQGKIIFPGNIDFPCSTGHDQDGNLTRLIHTVDPYSARYLVCVMTIHHIHTLLK